jgi:hypothetical protein
VTPAATSAAVKFEIAVRIELPVAHDRATNDILDERGHSGWMSANDSPARFHRDGTS